MATHPLMQVAIDEAYGRIEAPPELADDLDTWRNLLVAAVQDAQQQLSDENARWAEGTTSRLRGAAFKAEKAEHLERRARIMYFKSKVEGRLREVKAQLQTTNRAQHNWWLDLVVWLLNDLTDPEDEAGLLADVPEYLRPRLTMAFEELSRPEVASA